MYFLLGLAVVVIWAMSIMLAVTIAYRRGEDDATRRCRYGELYRKIKRKKRKSQVEPIVSNHENSTCENTETLGLDVVKKQQKEEVQRGSTASTKTTHPNGCFI